MPQPSLNLFPYTNNIEQNYSTPISSKLNSNFLKKNSDDLNISNSKCLVELTFPVPSKLEDLGKFQRENFLNPKNLEVGVDHSV